MQRALQSWPKVNEAFYAYIVEPNGTGSSCNWVNSQDASSVKRGDRGLNLDW